MHTELLEYVFTLSQESSVSDLRNPQQFQSYLPILKELPPEQFSLQAWEYCYLYLSGKTEQFQSIEEAFNAIQKWTQ